MQLQEVKEVKDHFNCWPVRDLLTKFQVKHVFAVFILYLNPCVTHWMHFGIWLLVCMTYLEILFGSFLHFLASNIPIQNLMSSSFCRGKVLFDSFLYTNLSCLSFYRGALCNCSSTILSKTFEPLCTKNPVPHFPKSMLARIVHCEWIRGMFTPTLLWWGRDGEEADVMWALSHQTGSHYKVIVGRLLMKFRIQETISSKCNLTKTRTLKSHMQKYLIKHIWMWSENSKLHDWLWP